MNKKFQVAGFVGCLLLGTLLVVAAIGAAIILAPPRPTLGPPFEKQRSASRYADRSPRWSPDGSTIVVNIGYNLFLVDVDSGQTTRITSSEGSGQFSPALSRDGLVAFFDVSGVRPCISITNNNSTDAKCHAKISTPGPWAIPMWSPSGSQIAFSVGQWGSEYSWAVIMSSEGKNVASYRNSFGGGGTPRCSNSGQYVLFTWAGIQKCGYIIDIPCVITVLDVDGTSSTLLDVEILEGTLSGTKPRREAVLSPAVWASDDKTIYYALRQGVHLPTIIYSYDLVNRDPTSILELPLTTVPDLNISPYDDTLMFIAYKNRLDDQSRSVKTLYTIRPDGTELRIVATSEMFGGSYIYRQLRASWSPDGELIAVLNSDTGDLFTIAPDGSGIRLLATLAVDGLDRPSSTEIFEEIESQIERQTP